jgi:tetratricopeptide (TPR) repeat protein
MKNLPFAMIGFIALLAGCTPSDKSVRESMGLIVSRIQHADYEGSQLGMQKAYDDLAPFLENPSLVSQARYWRGFAMWRRAVNGFNDGIDADELENDLRQALNEFQEATAKNPGFVEAKIGRISCLGYLAFMNRQDQSRAKEFVSQLLPIVAEVKQAVPDNPRFLWVLGPILWNTPAERGGGQDKAIENYEHGLALFEKIDANTDPLEPSWGRPELMMNLAYSHLNKSKPDVEDAELYARSALELVPNWHYVRDILLKQILEAKAKATEN